jgi:diguanylate cyclase (GGDEF)-like protein
VKLDITNPTKRRVREGMVSGAIAESIAVPVLLTAIFVDQSPTNWGDILGAAVCILVSVIYLAFFVAVTKGNASMTARANAGFIVVCLGIAALGFIELGSSDKLGTYLPAILVGVAFVCVIGDRPMRIGIDLFAIAVVSVVSWAEGLRGDSLASVIILYASTIVVITWVIARALGSLTGPNNLQRSVDALNEIFDDAGRTETDDSTETIKEVFRRGLPVVADLMPAEQVVVFTRNGKSGRFTPLVTWPDDHEDVAVLSEQPELDQALRADSVVLNEAYCAIPVGYCMAGELVMMVKRLGPERHEDEPAGEAADLLAAAFLRVNSRVNFVSGLQAQTRTDPLTGLANRRCLYERIEIEMAHALRSESPLSVAMIDLDHFKLYNDAHGHVAGDALLRGIAALMVSNVRGQDLVSRYGGEEFCLVMPDTDLVGGHHLLDKLRAGGREATTEFGVTLSAGLTSWDGIESTTSFIERADQALYRAKESGRNRVVSIQAFTEF